MADAMEMMILSILSPALKCDWWLESWQQALITTVRLCHPYPLLIAFDDSDASTHLSLSSSDCFLWDDAQFHDVGKH